jgi:hypothetical protein
MSDKTPTQNTPQQAPKFAVFKILPLADYPHLKLHERTRLCFSFSAPNGIIAFAVFKKLRPKRPKALNIL